MRGLVGYFLFRDHGFFFPNIFCWFLFAVNYKDIVCELFPVKIILHSSWYPPLIYIFAILFSMCSSVFVFCCFFLSTRCCKYYMNYWTHPPTSEYVERVKNTWSITLGYIFLWNVIKRIYCQCLQLISKTYF